MPAEVIGRCRCPVCASDKASLRLSAKQLAYVHCNACHFQGFSRSDHSDAKLRALLLAEPVQLLAPAASAPAAPPTDKPSWGLKSW